MQLSPVLTIAGSDSSGGAGIQADLKAFTAVGTYGMSVLTALTAQNTYGVRAIHVLPPDFVQAQLEAVFADIVPKAIKTGMLADAPTIKTVQNFLAQHAMDIPVVVDPVFVATSGARLLEPAAEAALRDFAAQAYIATPNLIEAAFLAGAPVPQSEEEFFALATKLSEQFPQPYWLVKGGHSSWEKHTVTSLLLRAGRLYQKFVQERLPLPRPPHGTGCTLASAIAAFTAKGLSPVEAVQRGLDFVYHTLKRADLHLGGAAVVPNPTWND